MINLKLDRYPLEEDEVMLMLERVSEAQRFAAIVSVYLNIYPSIYQIYLSHHETYSLRFSNYVNKEWMDDDPAEIKMK